MRITHLDGLRGLAILLVLFYHLFARWAELVSWGSLTAVPVIRTGYHGVELFFLISGFVILMTLERSPNLFSFAWKRWLRLFPAMLICSVLIFATAWLVPERPRGLPQWKDLVPGLLFIDPNILDKFGFEAKSLEGVFWSLYVEVKFYAFAAAVYFLCRRNAAVLIAALTAAYLLSLVGIGGILAFEYYGWFAAGAAFYLAHKGGDRWFLASVLLALLAVIFNNNGGESLLTLWAVVYIFALSIISPRLQKWLSSPTLMWFGFVSYPLYLIHENLMIGLVVKFGAWAAAPAVALVIAIAWLVAKYGEPFVKRFLKLLEGSR